MEGFNFFGVKGKLKNVQYLIQEKAQDLFEASKREEETLINENNLKKEIDRLDKKSSSNRSGKN